MGAILRFGPLVAAILVALRVILAVVPFTAPYVQYLDHALTLFGLFGFAPDMEVQRTAVDLVAAALLALGGGRKLFSLIRGKVPARG